LPPALERAVDVNHRAKRHTGLRQRPRRRARRAADPPLRNRSHERLTLLALRRRAPAPESRFQLHEHDEQSPRLPLNDFHIGDAAFDAA
jgi:hypothetical protein